MCGSVAALHRCRNLDRNRPNRPKRRRLVRFSRALNRLHIKRLYEIIAGDNSASTSPWRRSLLSFVGNRNAPEASKKIDASRDRKRYHRSHLFLKGAPS
jgi:hypothetical protein